MTCSGSGKTVVKADAWNIKRKNASWYSEGWRTTCPYCGKICAVPPRSHAIQKHQALTPKLSKAEKTMLQREALDQLYERIYAHGLAADSLRPVAGTVEAHELPTWIMAYHDGLADGGHNMKLGAFKRWLAKN